MASITDELSEWAKTLTHWWYDPVKDEYTYTTGIMPPSIDATRLDSSILAIADRIDAEHEAKVSYWQGASYKDGYENGYDDGFASAGDWTEHGWVRLPVDADGVPIRVGDVMDGNRGTVTCIRDAGHGWEIVTDHMYSYNPADLHHHKLTVEDVLRQVIACANNGTHVHGALDTEQIVAEYAAKLQLKEEA